MAKTNKLSAQVRSGVGRTAVRKIKTAGLVPAVMYSKKDEALNLQVNAREISLLLSHATSEHILVDLEIADGAQVTNKLALIQEVQHHPLRRNVLHVDFHAVRADERIHAKIPVETIGESTGVKNKGGTLEIILHELDVECLPMDLPEVIRIDITTLDVGQSLHIKEIAMPNGVHPKLSGDVAIIHVSAPRTEVAAEGDAAGPEVLKEKKPGGKAAAAKAPAGKAAPAAKPAGKK